MIPVALLQSALELLVVPTETVQPPVAAKAVAYMTMSGLPDFGGGTG